MISRKQFYTNNAKHPWNYPPEISLNRVEKTNSFWNLKTVFESELLNKRYQGNNPTQRSKTPIKCSLKKKNLILIWYSSTKPYWNKNRCRIGAIEPKISRKQSDPNNGNTYEIIFPDFCKYFKSCTVHKIMYGSKYPFSYRSFRTGDVRDTS